MYMLEGGRDVAGDVDGDSDCVSEGLDKRYQDAVETGRPFFLEGGKEVVGGLDSFGLELLVDLAAGEYQALVGIHGGGCRDESRISDVSVDLQAQLGG